MELFLFQKIFLLLVEIAMSSLNFTCIALYPFAIMAARKYDTVESTLLAIEFTGSLNVVSTRILYTAFMFQRLEPIFCVWTAVADIINMVVRNTALGSLILHKFFKYRLPGFYRSLKFSKKLLVTIGPGFLCSLPTVIALPALKRNIVVAVCLRETDRFFDNVRGLPPVYLVFLVPNLVFLFLGTVAQGHEYSEAFDSNRSLRLVKAEIYSLILFEICIHTRVPYLYIDPVFLASPWGFAVFIFVAQFILFFFATFPPLSYFVTNKKLFKEAKGRAISFWRKVIKWFNPVKPRVNAETVTNVQPFSDSS